MNWIIIDNKSILILFGLHWSRASENSNVSETLLENKVIVGNGL